MHPTIDVFAAMIEASPKAMAACRAIGSTPAQVAFAVITDIAAAPDQRTRDAMIGFFAQEHGLLGVRSEAEFGAMSEHLVEHIHGGRMTALPFEPKRSPQELAEMVAMSRKGTGREVSPKQVLHVAQSMAKASAAQGLSQRMRERDSKQPERQKLPEHLTRAARDDAERRALIESQLSEDFRAPSYAGVKRESEMNTRQTIEHAMDRAWAHDHLAQSDADPFEGLRDASNVA